MQKDSDSHKCFPNVFRCPAGGGHGRPAGSPGCGPAVTGRLGFGRPPPAARRRGGTPFKSQFWQPRRTSKTLRYYDIIVFL